MALAEWDERIHHWMEERMDDVQKLAHDTQHRLPILHTGVVSFWIAVRKSRRAECHQLLLVLAACLAGCMWPWTEVVTLPNMDRWRGKIYFPFSFCISPHPTIIELLGQKLGGGGNSQPVTGAARPSFARRNGVVVRDRHYADSQVQRMNLKRSLENSNDDDATRGKQLKVPPQIE